MGPAPLRRSGQLAGGGDGGAPVDVVVVPPGQGPVGDQELEHQGQDEALQRPAGSRERPGSNAARRQLLDALFTAGRELSAAAVMFHTALAARQGLTATEEKALDLLDRYGPLTGRQLAERSGLAPASVSNLADRLEAKGFARRTPTRPTAAACLSRRPRIAWPTSARCSPTGSVNSRTSARNTPTPNCGPSPTSSPSRPAGRRTRPRVSPPPTRARRQIPMPPGRPVTATTACRHLSGLRTAATEWTSRHFGPAAGIRAQSTPASRTMMASCTRLAAFNLARARDMCAFTVASPMYS